VPRAEATNREIGAAQNGFVHAIVGDVVHLAVQKLGVPDGADIHLFANPCGALAGNALLLQAVGKVQALAVEYERLLLGLVRVQRGDKAGLAKEEIQVLNPVEVIFQGFVGVYGEISGDNRKSRALLDFCFQKVGDEATAMIVPYA
jgi:hypothetical protein